MPKIKQSFRCSECNYESPKWLGNCPSCKSWNTFVEQEIVDSKSKPRPSSRAKVGSVLSFSDVSGISTARIKTGDTELDLVLSSGMVRGQVLLLGGEPGIGKSTLLLQIAIKNSHSSLYVSGEESAHQVKLRASRLLNDLSQTKCKISTEVRVEHIIEQANEEQPSLLIIDSIQTVRSLNVESAPGSISQIRESAMILQQYAKARGIIVFIIGHINKEGSIAGPKILEHIVDTVLQFEGERNHSYRVVRCLKNRFGSVNTMGIYEMTQAGLKAVEDPSGLLLSQRDDHASGNSIAAITDGNRSMLIETQALVSSAVYGTPQRSATGYDLRRLNMMLAVLEKRCNFFFGQSDVFLNIAGGFKISDPALDFSVCAALISSLEDAAIPFTSCFAGEVGLSGEVRSVSRLDLRVKEAQKMGFDIIYVSKFGHKPQDWQKYAIQVRAIANLKEWVEDMFG